MKNRKTIVSAALLAISIACYFTVIFNGSVRTVDFISILGIGALAGVLLTQLFKTLKNDKLA